MLQLACCVTVALHLFLIFPSSGISLPGSRKGVSSLWQRICPSIPLPAPVVRSPSVKCFYQVLLYWIFLCFGTWDETECFIVTECFIYLNQGKSSDLFSLTKNACLFWCVFCTESHCILTAFSSCVVFRNVALSTVLTTHWFKKKYTILPLHVFWKFYFFYSFSMAFPVLSFLYC